MTHDTPIVVDGPKAALLRKARRTPPVAPEVDGRVEAHLTKLACSTPPEGRNRWPLRLLADKAVELQLVDSLSPADTAKDALKPGCKTAVHPAEQDGTFVARMEQVLEVCARPYEARFPVVCMDEQPLQLLSERRRTVSLGKGRGRLVDYRIRP